MDLGANEILVIALAAMLLIRPQDLPRVFRLLGRWYGKFKAACREVSEFKEEMIKEIEKNAPAEDPESDLAAEAPAAPAAPQRR